MVETFFYEIARPERLFAATPRILRFAPDRRRAARDSVHLGRTAKVVELDHRVRS
jgi:hypothetical protein